MIKEFSYDLICMIFYGLVVLINIKTWYFLYPVCVCDCDYRLADEVRPFGYRVCVVTREPHRESLSQ